MRSAEIHSFDSQHLRDALETKRVLIAGYGLPAEIAITMLFGLGMSPSQLALVTHGEDNRNTGLRQIAQLRGIPVWDSPPDDIQTLSLVRGFTPDFLLSMHYRRRVPKTILDLLPLGAVNLHPSLLPHYRGTNSVAWALINGESETGFTYHRMDENFDTGNILIQERIPIHPGETAFSLFHRQILCAMARLEEVLVRVICEDPGHPQEKGGSYYPRKLPFEGKINRSWTIDQIERFARAMYFPPFKPAIVELEGIQHPIRNINDYVRLIDSHH